jgi:hypothetical protein
MGFDADRLAALDCVVRYRRSDRLGRGSVHLGAGCRDDGRTGERP